jgi:hypothetical protein
MHEVAGHDESRKATCSYAARPVDWPPLSHVGNPRYVDFCELHRCLPPNGGVRKIKSCMPAGSLPDPR